MIETKIIETHVAPESFVIGKIASLPPGDSLLLFDTHKMEMMQISLSPGHTILSNVSLNNIPGIEQQEPIQQIDSIFTTAWPLLKKNTAQHMVIADSRSGKLFKFPMEFDEQGAVSLRAPEHFALKTGSIIVSIMANGAEYLLLDKGTSMIRVFNKDFQETRTVGSRMGYVMAYAQEVELRLGFEIPEDMVISQEEQEGKRRLLVSDSGNKRLLVIAMDLQSITPYKLEQVIPLPEFPFKIIAWDEKADRIVVSDFDRSFMIASLRYGFIAQQESQPALALDFFPGQYNYSPEKKTAYTCLESGEPVELSISPTPLETIASEAGNLEAVMQMMVDQNRGPEARQLVEKNSHLLPLYMTYIPGGDKTFDERLITYINETFTRIMAENKKLAQEISLLSEDFMVKYKSIPDSDDVEAANIDKENIRHRMFLKIKGYRNGIKEIQQLHQVVKNSPPAAEILAHLLDQWYEHIKIELPQLIETIESNLLQYNELELLRSIVSYNLIVEEENVLFKQRGLKYKKPFADIFLLSFLANFYYNIGEMFRKRNKIDQYISFTDREITMYQDKISIFRQFCNRLITLGKRDDVLRMLAKVPDRNKEYINHLYYQVYLAKGDEENAFRHLKRELDLYPHRTNLLPALFNLNRLSDQEIRQYIDNILEKSDQAIDVYCNAAKALKSIGKYKESEFYIGRELQQYPENEAALLEKVGLFSMHPPDSQSTQYYRSCWNQLSAFLKLNRNAESAIPLLPLFSALNHVTMKTEELKDLLSLKELLNIDICKKELAVYLSYITNIQKRHNQADYGPTLKIERFSHGDYLSAYSTKKLAYDHFFEEAKHLLEDGHMEEMFALLEDILKYNPGDEKIFHFLDSLCPG